jgi:hypothetical protein
MISIEFVNREWLPYVLIAVLAVFGFGIAWMLRRNRLVRFYGRKGGHIYGQLRISLFVAVLTLICASLGLLLCEPYVKYRTPHDVYEPLHIVLAVDISRSMLVPATPDRSRSATQRRADFVCSPSRLDIAAQEVKNFIDVLQDQRADKVALVVFARYAYPAIPVLSDDYLLFRRRFEKEMLLENVLTMAEGTNHWYAVERSLTIFNPDDPYKKVLIILTDGEPSAPEDAIFKSRIEALEALSQTGGIDLHVVGIGEPDVRQPVPLEWQANGCPDEEKGYLLETDGLGSAKVMTTVTDVGALTSLAEDLGAEYVHSTTGADLADKLKRIVDKERMKVGVKYSTTFADLSEYIIMILLALQAVLVLLKAP